MLTPEDHILRTIRASTMLWAGCSDFEQFQSILCRTHEMMLKSWQFRLDTYSDSMLNAMAFWNHMACELVTKQDSPCYSFLAVYGPTIGRNTQRECFDVILRMTPMRSAQEVTFMLSGSGLRHWKWVTAWRFENRKDFTAVYGY